MLTVPAQEEALPLFQLDPQRHHHLMCLFREPPYSHLEDRDVPDLGIMLAQPRSEAAVAQQAEPASSAVALHWVRSSSTTPNARSTTSTFSSVITPLPTRAYDEPCQYDWPRCCAANENRYTDFTSVTRFTEMTPVRWVTPCRDLYNGNLDTMHVSLQSV